jgi:hypothetical protein
MRSQIGTAERIAADPVGRSAHAVCGRSGWPQRTYLHVRIAAAASC